MKAICCSLNRDFFVENPPPGQEQVNFFSFKWSEKPGAGQSAIMRAAVAASRRKRQHEGVGNSFQEVQPGADIVILPLVC